MRTVTLGESGLAVSQIGIGCMGMSELYGPAVDSESIATLHRAVDLGVTLFDTSDTYGVGANEQLLGKFLASVDRDHVVVATKFGVRRDPVTTRPLGVHGDRAYVRAACHQSLRNIGIDQIDLYYQHFPDPKTPIEETVGAMAELAAEGKIRHLGLSNVTGDQIRKAHGVARIAAVQNEWSLFSREVEESVVPACAELGIGLVAYSPLARGFLTGVYTSTDGLAPNDFRQAVPRFAGPHAAHNQAVMRPLRRIAEAHEATPGQIALAWLIQNGAAQGVTVVPIPGTKHTGRVAENAAAANISLTDGELAALDPLAAQVSGSGLPVIPPEIAKMFGRA
jgi:aryl-alcohol dehydrogenase-like predicted oxidoreductase